MEHRQTKFYHAFISIAAMTILILTGIVKFGSEPQIPLIFGCFVAGLVAVSIGYKWGDILEGMVSGITRSLEAVMILMLIGILVGVWIASGTVPSMIYYGLNLISAKYFLCAAALICGIVAFAIGAWGTVGTVGLAFMGIGSALAVPAPMVAGCIITGAYFGEIVSPLSDCTNLTAAVVGCNVFDLMKKILPLALLALSISEVVYIVLGLQYDSQGEQVMSSVEPLLQGLKETFTVSPAALLPMALMVLCIVFQFPAPLSMFVGIFAGIVVAVFLQGAQLSELFLICFSGYVGNTGSELLDTLLSAGGLSAMFNTISIIVIAMAFGGLMQQTGQMTAFVSPVIQRLRGKTGLAALGVLSCIGVNVILPDQYLGISVPGQMYAQEFEKRGMGRLELSEVLLSGGAVTSPLIPWNTCGIYCTGFLGVSPLQYLPFAFLGLFLPVLIIIYTFLVEFREKKYRERIK